MEAAGAEPRKSLGQNFLIDEAVLDAIVRAAGAEERTALEIGPGPGLLTDRLAERARVVALEKDDRWATFLRLHFEDRSEVNVVHGDALEVDWTLGVPAGSVLVGNLPYYVSAPLLIRALRHRRHFTQATFMLQEEVGMRLTAAPGSKIYGRLSVMAQSCARVDRVRRVPPGAFWPPPKVHSWVVRLRFEPGPSPDAFDALERLVKAAFGQRRKRLANALTAGRRREGSDRWERAARRFDLSVRAEQWSPSEFARLLDWLAADAPDAWPFAPREGDPTGPVSPFERA
jgi:16S rRNA (adenine1518-N6/adenine1519-N6)-dimethyltransferase